LARGPTRPAASASQVLEGKVPIRLLEHSALERHGIRHTLLSNRSVAVIVALFHRFTSGPPRGAALT
jgi:hypothetical protein